MLEVSQLSSAMKLINSRVLERYVRVAVDATIIGCDAMEFAPVADTLATPAYAMTLSDPPAHD